MWVHGTQHRSCMDKNIILTDRVHVYEDVSYVDGMTDILRAELAAVSGLRNSGPSGRDGQRRLADEYLLSVVRPQRSRVVDVHSGPIDQLWTAATVAIIDLYDRTIYVSVNYSFLPIIQLLLRHRQDNGLHSRLPTL